MAHFFSWCSAGAALSYLFDFRSPEAEFLEDRKSLFNSIKARVDPYDRFGFSLAWCAQFTQGRLERGCVSYFVALAFKQRAISVPAVASVIGERESCMAPLSGGELT
ncbi:MAG TPA: hypothetical protein DD435_01695 [Cyanobacteria bacterium UBA8530]|nr:hypothetical protein [Cyanobacteria bacterium UBA8530]